MDTTAVVGGGIVGLCCAHALRRQGDRVVVFDRSVFGAACSAGNAGLIVPSFSGPLPQPGLARATLASVIRPDSPLYVPPRFDLDVLRWLWAFWRRCNARDYDAGYAAVAALNRRTAASYDALRADGVEFEMHRDGLVFVFLSEAGLARELEDLARLPQFGLGSPQPLSARDVRALEPALSDRVVGGVLLDTERHARPETIAAGLLKRLRDMGVELRPEVQVTGVDRRGARARAVITSRGAVAADRVVLAAGAWTGALARRFGFTLPVIAGKGYSITVSDPALRLRRALHLGEARIACSPFDGALRLAGTVELAKPTPILRARRLDAIRRAASRYLPGWQRGDGEVEWMGMRPFLPDGLPAIGRAPGCENVFVAAGHGMLGITLAPVTGALIADLVCRGEASEDIRPFDPGRFGRRKIREPPVVRMTASDASGDAWRPAR